MESKKNSTITSVEKREKRGFLVTIIYGLLVLMILVGTSYALWSYDFIGGTNELKATSFELEFLESSNEVINIDNAIPVSDDTGKNQSTAFEFLVRSETERPIDFKYYLYVEKLEITEGYNSLKDNEVKIYLTDKEDNVLLEPTLVSELDNYLIYTKINAHNENNVEIVDEYKLKVWVADSVTGEDWTNETKLEYKFKIGVTTQYRESTEITGRVYLVSNEDYVANRTTGFEESELENMELYNGENWENGYAYVYLNYTNSLYESVVVDGEQDIRGSKFFFIEKEGEQTTTILATDKYGKQTTITVPTKLDRTAPDTPTVTNTSGGAWSRSAVTLTAASDDGQSGLEKIEYSTDQQNWVTSWDTDTVTSTSKTYASSDEQNSVVYIRAKDNVDNFSEVVSTNVRIDITPPTIYNHCFYEKIYESSVYKWRFAYYFSDYGSGLSQFRWAYCYNVTGITESYTCSYNAVGNRYGSWEGASGSTWARLTKYQITPSSGSYMQTQTLFQVQDVAGNVYTSGVMYDTWYASGSVSPGYC